jgi:hypothetical protein
MRSCSSSQNRRFGEYSTSIFRDPHGDRIPRLSYCGITVDQPLHWRILFMFEEHCRLGCFHGGNYRYLLGLLSCSSNSKHKRYPSMERLINSDSTVTQLWNPITLKNPEGGGDMFSETSTLTTAIRYKVPEHNGVFFISYSYTNPSLFSPP